MHKDYCMKCLRDKLNWSFFLVLQTATNLQLVFRNISCEHPEMWSWSASNLIFPCCQSQEMPHQVATRVCHADAKLPVAMCASCQVPFVFSAKMWASRSQCPWNEGFVKVSSFSSLNTSNSVVSCHKLSMMLLMCLDFPVWEASQTLRGCRVVPDPCFALRESLPSL